MYRDWDTGTGVWLEDDAGGGGSAADDQQSCSTGCHGEPAASGGDEQNGEIYGEKLLSSSPDVQQVTDIVIGDGVPPALPGMLAAGGRASAPAHAVYRLQYPGQGAIATTALLLGGGRSDRRERAEVGENWNGWNSLKHGRPLKVRLFW